MSERISKISDGRTPQFYVFYLLLCLALFALFAFIAARLGTDGTPDFKIYHFYNGYAFHVDRTGLDIFAAQMQTGFFPGLDAIYYSLFRALNDTPRLLNVVLSLPYGAAASVLFLIARLFIPVSARLRNPVAAAAAIAGLTGAAALPTMATTMSDVVPSVPLLIGLCLWATFETNGTNTLRKAILIGVLCGLAVGLKLTLAPVFVGLFLVILFAGGLKSVLRPWAALSFGAAGVVVFFAVDSFWLWGNWTRYGNPIFPLMNHVFRSGLVDASPWTDLRFMPKTVLMTLIYPAFWAFDLSHDAIELNMRDPRLLVGCVSALFIVVSYLRRRWRSPAESEIAVAERIAFAFACLFLVSYALWLKTWSIYRYLAVQEMLSCILLLAAFTTIGARKLRLGWRLAVYVVALAAIVGSTAYPWWSRAQRGPAAMTVNLPPIEADSMVVFLDGYAYSYLVPSMPGTVRAIGANSNLVRPGSKGSLEERIEDAIRGHSRPLWGLEYPEAFPGIADVTLSHHHLQRTDECALLDSSIEERKAVRICRLKRVP